MSDSLRFFKMSFKYGLILLRYYSFNSVKKKKRKKKKLQYGRERNKNPSKDEKQKLVDYRKNIE